MKERLKGKPYQETRDATRLAVRDKWKAQHDQKPARQQQPILGFEVGFGRPPTPRNNMGRPRRFSK